MFKPQGKRIAGFLYNNQEKVGDLYIPQNAKVNSKQIKVIAVGDKVKGILKDDILIIPDHTGIDVRYEMANFIVVNQQDVIAIV